MSMSVLNRILGRLTGPATAETVLARMHVVVISWQGMHDKAQAIASAAQDVAGQVSVIYSNDAGDAETGAGDWIEVSQQLYFGAKFARGLTLCQPGEMLMLIQADAQCEDWGALLHRSAGVFASHPQVGLWAPRIDNTPYRNQLVELGAYEQPDLWHVAQTDGIVLAIDAPVLKRLSELDFTDNALGWGIDWAAIAIAQAQGRLVLRDHGASIHHPQSRGYDGTEAETQMQGFLGQLSPEETDIYKKISGVLHARQIRLVPQSGFSIHIPPSFLTSDIDHMTSPADTAPLSMIFNERLLVRFPVDQEPEQAHVEWPGGRADLTACTRAERFLDVPRVLTLSPFETEEAMLLEDPGDAWGCPGLPTYRLIPADRDEPVTCQLGSALEIPADTGEIHVHCALGVHRGTADLRIVLEHDGSDEPEETYIHFDPAFNAVRAEGNCQPVRLHLPNAHVSRRLRVEICYWGSSSPADVPDPSVMFITPLLLLGAAHVSEHLSPILTSGALNGDGVWYEASLKGVKGGAELVTPQRRQAVLGATDTTFAMESRGPNTMAITASAPARVVLFLNRLPLLPLTLAGTAEDVTLPKGFLSDPENVLELRDLSGTLVYASYRHTQASPAKTGQDLGGRHADAWAIEAQFDTKHYLAGFPEGATPADPVSHYLSDGWLEGRDPAPWFSTRHYLATHKDVAAAGMNPFLHYTQAGQSEGRKLQGQMPRPADTQMNASALYEAHAQAVAPGDAYEALDPNIAAGADARAKVLAYYLPQYHAIPENDHFWGKGFTEWRNVGRGMPRFKGHVQPRLPRDTGFYDLKSSNIMRDQIRMARDAGLHGFCFYHYWFDGKRVLEAPMERFLANPDLDFPFCIMWANENWTRTWDGHDNDVLLMQNYLEEDDIAFVDDLARHFADPRYIRLNDRPLFFIYRPGHVPDGRQTISRWRRLLRDRHGMDPLFYMAQGFGDLDPGTYGLDGAIEFPPHKLCQGLPDISDTLDMLDHEYDGQVLSYDAVIERARAEAVSPFPLIRTITPSWDNESRRPGRGMVLQGSTPEKFETWARESIGYARANRVEGEAIICVNAWNEWCEGAYLEPDVHYGGAYLNALSRAIHGVQTRPEGRMKVLITSHDANPNGAQMLAINMGRTMVRDFGAEVTYLIGKTGTLLPKFQEIGTAHVVDMEDGPAVSQIAGRLRDEGYCYALTNTAVSGGYVPALKALGFNVTSLIHELPTILRHYGLETQVAAIAGQSDRVVFPAKVVHDGFVQVAGNTIAGASEILPQGLYKTELLDRETGDAGLRAELGLSENSRIVLGVGYADLRKGIDRYVETALRMCATHDDIAFVWMGNPAPEALDWYLPGIRQAGLSDRIRITGHVDNVARYYSAVDLFFLTSREDPFPSVVMEALAMGLPIVGYEGCGGCDGLVGTHGTLVSPDNPAAAEKAILSYLDQASSQAEKSAATRRQAMRDNHRFDDYVFDLLTRFDPSLARVSVVVPNYNYEDHIGPRLSSIFNQSYPVTETLVLDDASSDNSVSRIRDVTRAAGRNIRLEVNESNSGGPFPQWRKGAAMARGDYIWIAEADDLAKPDFLDTLVARMEESGAAMGFCDSRTMDEADTPTGDSYVPYIDEIDPGSFAKPFEMEGPAFLARFLAVKNVILNVSGVLFRREALLAALEAVGDDLDGYGVAGDWRLYVEICAAGGKVVWEPRALNAHRRHSTSVTHALKVERHLSEIAEMHRIAGERVALSKSTKEAQAAHFAACQDHLKAE